MNKKLKMDLVVAPIEMSWQELVDLAKTGERIGCGAFRVWDHLTGSSENSKSRCMECWTVLSALAALTDSITLGPLVINPLHRDAVTLAVMAATLQEISDGRLEIGFGAGSGPGGVNAREQEVLGRTLQGPKERRQMLEDYITQIRKIWSGDIPHYNKLTSPPPLLIGGFGPKMATMAGKTGDGFVTSIAVPNHIELITLATRVAGREDYPIIVTDELEDAGKHLADDRGWIKKLIAAGVSHLAITVHHADQATVAAIEEFAVKVEAAQ